MDTSVVNSESYSSSNHPVNIYWVLYYLLLSPQVSLRSPKTSPGNLRHSWELLLWLLLDCFSNLPNQKQFFLTFDLSWDASLASLDLLNVCDELKLLLNRNEENWKGSVFWYQFQVAAKNSGIQGYLSIFTYTKWILYMILVSFGSVCWFCVWRSYTQLVKQCSKWLR